MPSWRQRPLSPTSDRQHAGPWGLWLLSRPSDWTTPREGPPQMGGGRGRAGRAEGPRRPHSDPVLDRLARTLRPPRCLPQAPKPVAAGLGRAGGWGSPQPLPSGNAALSAPGGRGPPTLRPPASPMQPPAGWPQTQLGQPWPSYWAALDGVRSLILPGNDDGGALHAATGRPRPGPRASHRAPRSPLPQPAHPTPPHPGQKALGRVMGGRDLGKGAGAPPPASQRPRNAVLPAAAPRVLHGDLGIRTLRCPGRCCCHTQQVWAEQDPTKGSGGQGPAGSHVEPRGSRPTQLGSPPSLAAAILPPAGQGGPATEQTSPPMAPGLRPQGPLALEEAGRVALSAVLGPPSPFLPALSGPGATPGCSPLRVFPGLPQRPLPASRDPMSLPGPCEHLTGQCWISQLDSNTVW